MTSRVHPRGEGPVQPAAGKRVQCPGGRPGAAGPSELKRQSSAGRDRAPRERAPRVGALRGPPPKGACAMPHRAWRRLRPRFAVIVVVLLALAPPRSAFAYVDSNLNRIDDRIEAVHANGWNAAFEHGDPAQRMVIGVENPASILYAVYVRYDHKPVVGDQLALGGTGVTMVWPFVHIDCIESRATWNQV